jgi:hypothetical protein
MQFRHNSMSQPEKQLIYCQDFGKTPERSELCAGCSQRLLPAGGRMISSRGWNDDQGVRSHVDDP